MGDNQAPALTLSVENGETTVLGGRSVRLRAAFSDPEGDTVTLTWTAPDGALEIVTPIRPRWTAPASTQEDEEYTVTCQADDGTNQVTGSLTLTVPAQSFSELLISLIEGMDPAPRKALLFREPISDLPAYFLRYEGRNHLRGTSRFGVVLLHKIETEGNPYEGIEALVDNVYHALDASPRVLPIDTRGVNNEQIMSREAAGAIIVVEEV